MPKRFVRMAVLLVFPSLVGAVVNAVRPDGIRWIVSHDEIYPPPKEDQLTATIGREEVKAALDQGTAILIDARTEEQYCNGHIPTAMNFPAHLAFDNQEWLFQHVDMAAFAIVYCGGAECDESREVFDLMKANGYQNVRLYFGGWQDWTAANLPVEEGAR